MGQNPDFRKLFQQLNGQYSGKKPEDGQGEKDGTPEPERFDSNGNPVKKKKKRRRFARGGKVAAAAVILILLGTNSYYILDEENYAVVSTLGSAQAVSQAGLHFKIPFIQNVRRVSKGIKGMPIGYDP